MAVGSTVDSQVIKALFADSSGLSPAQIEKIDFAPFNFDGGVTGSPKIITGMKGGSSTIKWGDDKNSLLRIRIFPQKRNNEYAEDLVLPMAIFQGIESDTAKAALNNDEMKGSWRRGFLANVGNYCVGQHLAAIGSGSVNAGFFFYDKYGFCMQISTPAESGVSLHSVEEIGRGVIEEVAKVLQDEGINPNPLDITGPFAFSKSSNTSPTIVADKPNGNETPGPGESQDVESAQITPPASQRNFWAFGCAAIAVLLAMLLVWTQRRKKSL